MVSVGTFLIYNIMESNELRIGNLVLNTDFNTVTEIKEGWQIDSCDVYYEPIPLTEEWLLKFGFEVFEFDHKDNQYSLNGRLIVIRNELFCDYGTDVVLKYVHQIQNLYFALINKELTL